MFRGLWIILTGWLIMKPCGAQQRETAYHFETADFRIEMAVEYFPQYQGKRLTFYSSARPGEGLCYSGNGESGACLKRFFGSVAAATYRFTPKRRSGRQAASFREVVTVLAQAAGLAGRDPYQREQALVQGVGSDIQAFGYDESEVEGGARPAFRSEWRGFWRVYRQELFVNGNSEQLAVIDWKHTVERIEVVRVARPPVADRHSRQLDVSPAR